MLDIGGLGFSSCKSAFMGVGGDHPDLKLSCGIGQMLETSIHPNVVVLIQMRSYMELVNLWIVH